MRLNVTSKNFWFKSISAFTRVKTAPDTVPIASANGSRLLTTSVAFFASFISYS